MAYGLPTAGGAVRKTGFMEYRPDGLLRLDVGRPDHLAPLLGFGGEELAKFGRLTGKRCIAQIAESRFHLGAHETRIGLPVEPFDDVRRRIPGGAQAKPRARLVARHEITEYRNVRQDLRARGRRHRQGAQLAGADISAPPMWMGQKNPGPGPVSNPGKGLPRYGTCSRPPPASVLNSSPRTCGALPAPADAMLILPGLALA